MDPTGRSVKSQFKLADREKAAYALITGDAELAAAHVLVKNLTTGEQTTVARSEAIAHLKNVTDLQKRV